MPGQVSPGSRHLRAVAAPGVPRYGVRISVPRSGTWGASRGGFEERLAAQRGPAIAGAEIESETRRGRDGVRVTIAVAVDALDPPQALTAAWNAFRRAADGDGAQWDLTAASAEIKPGAR